MNNYWSRHQLAVPVLVLTLSWFSTILGFGEESCTIRLGVIATGINVSDDFSAMETLSLPNESVRYVRVLVMFSSDAFSMPNDQRNDQHARDNPITIEVNEDSLSPRLVLVQPACYIRLVAPKEDGFVPYFHSLNITTPTFVPEKLYPVLSREPLPILIADLLLWSYPSKFPTPRRACVITNKFETSR